MSLFYEEVFMKLDDIFSLDLKTNLKKMFTKCKIKINFKLNFPLGKMGQYFIIILHLKVT